MPACCSCPLLLLYTAAGLPEVQGPLDDSHLLAYSPALRARALATAVASMVALSACVVLSCWGVAALDRALPAGWGPVLLALALTWCAASCWASSQLVGLGPGVPGSKAGAGGSVAISASSRSMA